MLKGIMKSNEIIQYENWLSLLIETYTEFPDSNLAKVIHYYLERILLHDEFDLGLPKSCHYISMKKFWYQQAYQ
jgi:hypothetical protein